MRKFLIITISILFLSFDLVEYSFYQKDDGPARFKAQHLYIFTKNFEWPASNSNDFTIAVLGNNTGLITELTKVTNNKTVGAKKIEIQNINSIAETAKPEILFILNDKSSAITEAAAKLKNGTLIITEKQGLAKSGATINFIIVENQIKFELNKASAGKAGLKVSAKIEPLAAKVME